MNTALITGASRGLGRALSIALVARGARVAGVARSQPALLALHAELGDRFVPVVGDVSDPEAAPRIAVQAAHALQSIDLLVHNASTLGPVPLRPLVEATPEDVAHVFRTNVIGPLALTRRVVGGMTLRGSGTVVGISSDAAVEAYPEWGAYGASKAAQDHLFRTLAAEHADLRFFTVDPGEMATQMHADALPDADPASLRRPEAVAEALIALLDHASSGRRYTLEVSS